MGMKKTMKSAAAKSMTKSGLVNELSEKTELNRKACDSILQCLAAVTEREVKKTGKITIPGIAMLKTRRKPATKAGKREVFGKVLMVKAKPAKTIVKAYCVAALKKSI